MLAMIILASLAGYSLSRLLPWSSEARRAGVCVAAGLALGPFLLGAGGVLTLGILAGALPSTHLVAVVVGLLGVALLALWRGRGIPQKEDDCRRAPRQFGELLVSGLLTLWIVALLVNVIFLPLTANDSLEYATVARLLYETRDLVSYPAIQPELSTSGFFGPWTHPPLYVSLSYLTQIIQGHADEPGFMRFVSPWFAVCSTLLIITLGSLLKRLFGLISALIFLSTPLLFSGADSASIDALPVLAIGLIVASVVCLEARPFVRGLFSGCAVALGLWTHSQAILFFPLALGAIALQNGLARWRTTTIESVALCASALLLGGWPYWRNVRIFGNPISDSPAVFALPSLDWTGYFSYARGLDNWAAVLQYGLLKGWFSFQSFGWAFWLMTLGVVLAIKPLRHPTWRATLLCGGRQALDSGSQLLWVSLGLISIYLGGVFASTLIGIDLMIKNDRYSLVILPCVSLLGGYGAHVLLCRGASSLADTETGSVKRDFLAGVGFFLGVALLVQFVVQGVYYRWRYVPAAVQISEADTPAAEAIKRSKLDKPLSQRRLEYFPNMAAMFWTRGNLPENALLLSLRPADMYYAQRKMVSYLDERLLPVYRETSPPRAAQMLRDLGITHLHVPDYGLPVMYNSVLDRIIDDPALSRLMYSASGTQVFQLASEGNAGRALLSFEFTDFTPATTDWTQYRQLNLGGQRLASALGFLSKRLPKDGISSSEWHVPLFHRDFSTMVANGRGRPLAVARHDLLPSIRGGEEYRVTFDLAGNAFVKLWLVQFDEKGRLLLSGEYSSGVDRIAEVVLNHPDETRRVSRRFLALPDAAYVRFGVEHLGYSEIQVRRAVLEHLGRPDSAVGGKGR
ncbi:MULTISPECIES: ArnT family glycosyltransferase [Candidatus Accumulibacter]|nr:hypothetical protein [Accumulibacter sp.]MBO3713496.1 hypothetical protein [Accumulibacter sp.]